MSYELLSDEMLLKLLQCSDEQAFKTLYQRHFAFVYKLSYKKVKNQQTAEDIVQQVFMGIWERRTKAIIESIEAYLLTAVKYRCISYFESKYTHTLPVEPNCLQSKSDSSSESRLTYEEFRNAVHRAVQHLPPKTREVFELSRFHNHTNREIATLLKISEKAVEYHITQSLRIMRQELRDYVQPAGLSLAIFFLFNSTLG